MIWPIPILRACASPAIWNTTRSVVAFHMIEVQVLKICSSSSIVYIAPSPAGSSLWDPLPCDDVIIVHESCRHGFNRLRAPARYTRDETTRPDSPLPLDRGQYARSLYILPPPQGLPFLHSATASSVFHLSGHFPPLSFHKQAKLHRNQRKLLGVEVSIRHPSDVRDISVRLNGFLGL